jgi:phage tail sheath gpL-like
MPISSAVDPSAQARAVGIETKFSDLRGGRTKYLPQQVAIVGGVTSTLTHTSTAKLRVTNAAEVGTAYGFGSPVHLAALQVMPVNGDGVGSIPVTVYALRNVGSPGAGTITPSGTATAAGGFYIMSGGVRSNLITVAIGDDDEAVVDAMVAGLMGQVNMPITALDAVSMVSIIAKGAGTVSNSIVTEVVGELPAGITLAIVQLASATGNGPVDEAMALFGESWETMVINCEDPITEVLDAYQTAGDARWGALTRKPFVAFSGNTDAAVGTAVTVPDARTTDKVNCFLTAPGSNDLPYVVAARQVARIAVVANSNPPQDYGSQLATGLNPGADGDQWTYPERDLAVKAGTSTSTIVGGVVALGDIITMYHPLGDPTPAYRYVVDIVKLMNIIYNLDLVFDSPSWAGAPLIPDDQATSNRSARQPKSAVAAVCGLLDSLGLEAIISNPEAAKASTFAEIDGSNPKRLNVATVVQLSSNTNIISVDLNFGFTFGG